MGAITIAFDTIIAGALALPWLLLVVHLFFPNGEQHVADLPKRIKEINQPAAMAVVLFAVTYLIGSAVSRTAQDFSNDDDLHLSITDLGWHPGEGHASGCKAGSDPGSRHLLLRFGMTQNRIFASVYCEKQSFQPPRRASAVLAAKIEDFRSHSCACTRTIRWHAHLDRNQEEQEEELNEDAGDVFGLEQGDLLLQSEDSTLHLRQLHDQVMVLRSAAFNAMIACALCLYAWGVRLRHEKPRSALRWLVALLPAGIFMLAAITIAHHFAERAPTDPPYMEFSILVVAGGGAWVLWLRRVRPADLQKGHRAPCRQWLAFAFLSFLLMGTAALAWWSSEVAYTEQVIYAYDSLPASGGK